VWDQSFYELSHSRDDPALGEVRKGERRSENCGTTAVFSPSAVVTDSKTKKGEQEDGQHQQAAACYCRGLLFWGGDNLPIPLLLVLDSLRPPAP